MEVNNNQKMREALAEIRLLLVKVPLSIKPGTACGIINAKVKHALSAPARNCDVFETETEMRGAFIDWYNETFGLKGSKDAIETCDLKHDVDGILHEYIDWLFAKAEGGA